MTSKGTVAVLDVGKTLTKLSLWTRDGEQLQRLTRRNRSVQSGGKSHLDLVGIRGWLGPALACLARGAPVPIDAVVPVAHGASAVLVREGSVIASPSDYEADVSEEVRAVYLRERDSFAQTGSPALSRGLNLGLQLASLQAERPELFTRDTRILLWPQFWAWLLSGVAASEVSSLGCHTDLWLPERREASMLARRHGWDRMMPPRRKAGEALGTMLPSWASRTGISQGTKIYCGVHDSNAALNAARGFAELRGREATIVSTGTWFVAMRTPGAGARVEIATLDPQRDCLVNVDVAGKLVPSARFMGGREIELLTELDSRRIDIGADQPTMLQALPAVVEKQAMVLPNFAPGAGPFGSHEGRWLNCPDNPAEMRAAVALYAALVTQISLELIGAREQILVEGRFAEAEVMVRALATLRPNDAIYTSLAHNDVSFGALRLINPHLRPMGGLTRTNPLPVSLTKYQARWLDAVRQLGIAA